ncbi:TMEM175 family protein [Vibrio rotiferianus]|uniref:TMEM175 family protein n=1 Tax=Vibrio rotiferianus TaxID=190895 RepID=UPI0015F4C9E2|nr:TMEM175 family protein [Vibrio rotiferianus]CAH1559403.1 Potassium channel HX13_20290 [Vibrio rotiferianus]
MKASRLEAFSDGVLAIIITIMVLEIRPPEEYTIDSLTLLIPKVLSYLVSFLYVGSYWNHHHHLFSKVKKIDNFTLWSNLHFLFWLSLVPVSTAWLGDSHEAFIPVLFYGIVLLMSAISLSLVHYSLSKVDKGSQPILHSIGKKGSISICIYLIAILISSINTYAACILYALVPIIWIVQLDFRVQSARDESL